MADDFCRPRRRIALGRSLRQTVAMSEAAQHDTGLRVTFLGTGDPFASGDPPLQSFPVTNANGAVIVDFTHPVDAGG